MWSFHSFRMKFHWNSFIMQWSIIICGALIFLRHQLPIIQIRKDIKKWIFLCCLNQQNIHTVLNQNFFFIFFPSFTFTVILTVITFPQILDWLMDWLTFWNTKRLFRERRSRSHNH
jgi:hypothetical protein